MNNILLLETPRLGERQINAAKGAKIGIKT
jgi:hypothetical protein